ncbi:MAG TPA: hypothetical protein VGG39_38240 [Polyangiaceae bacterium]|jgi:hypothetical protein
MVATKDAPNTHAAFRFGDAAPTLAAHEELWWFFNDAGADLVSAAPPTAWFFDLEIALLVAEERCAEAALATQIVGQRIDALDKIDKAVLEGVYTLHPRSVQVERALGVLAGAVEALPVVCAEHLAARMWGLTRAKTPAEWLEERVRNGGAAAVTMWAAPAEAACAAAVRVYDHVRGHGPKVVPGRLDEEVLGRWTRSLR